MQRQTIFVVDDSDTNLEVAADALEQQYRVVTISSAKKMFSLLEKLIPSLILLDVAMPDVNGFEAIKALKADNAYADIPVIFLTGMDDNFSEAQGFELGAVDFITKPFSKAVLLTRLKTQLNLDGLIRERTRQLSLLYNNIVLTLADLLESRDANTGGHIDRTTAYLRILSEAMLRSGVYADEMRSWNMESFISSARLHDLGKISISDNILNKPGPLTEEEFEMMKIHPAEGEKIVAKLISRTGESEFLYSAKLTAAYHHEKWDGSGYPYELEGRDIPLQGRIMAIVDVYDALTSVRPYKEAYSSQEAFRIIRAESGRHFDPKIAGVFTAIEAQIEFAGEEF